MVKRVFSAALSALLCATLLLATASPVQAASDTTPPVITAIRVKNPDVTKPGIVNVELDVIEEETGISDLQIQTTTPADLDRMTLGSGPPGLSPSGAVFYTGTVTIPIAVPASAADGLYYITTIFITDQAGNQNSYSTLAFIGDRDNLQSQDGDLLPTGTFNVHDAHNIAFEVALSNPKFLSRLADMPEGKTAKVMIDNASKGILPAAAFDAIRGKDKTLILYQGGAQWIFKGANITGASKDLDVRITFSQVSGFDYGVENQMVVAATFPENGILPGKATIGLKSDFLHNLYNINGKLLLYYYDGTSMIPEDGNFDMVIDGTDKWCHFDITHNSQFIISGTPVTEKPEKTPAPATMSFGKTTIRTVKAGGRLKALFPTPKTKEKVVWSSSKRSVATVNARTGVVTAKNRPGTTVITAKAGNQKASYIVYVYSPKQNYRVLAKPSVKKHGSVHQTKSKLTGNRYPGGTRIILNAYPKKGYTFEGWYDGKLLVSRSKRIHYIAAKNTTLTARFRKN